MFFASLNATASRLQIIVLASIIPPYTGSLLNDFDVIGGFIPKHTMPAYIFVVVAVSYCNVRVLLFPHVPPVLCIGYAI
jgi:hypothetical protein